MHPEHQEVWFESLVTDEVLAKVEKSIAANLHPLGEPLRDWIRAAIFEIRRLRFAEAARPRIGVIPPQEPRPIFFSDVSDPTNFEPSAKEATLEEMKALRDHLSELIYDKERGR